MNKFIPTSAWRLRKQLDDDFLSPVLDMAESLKGTRERKQFDAGNFDYCVNQLPKLSSKLKKFYKANK